MVATPHLHRKSDRKRGTVGVQMVLSMPTSFQHPPRGPSHGAKQCSKTYHFSDIATQSRFLGAPMSLHCDFNAPLRTKSCNWYWKRVHACPKSPVAHPQKHQNHHFFTKSFVFLYQNWQFLVVTTPHLHRKSVQSEVRWRSGWSQTPSCGHLLVQKLEQNLLF